jgi:hypothetical protein
MLISILWSYTAFPKSKSSSVLLAPFHLEPTPDLMTLDGEYHRLSYNQAADTTANEVPIERETKIYLPVLEIHISPKLPLALSSSDAAAT